MYFRPLQYVKKLLMVLALGEQVTSYFHLSFTFRDPSGGFPVTYTLPQPLQPWPLQGDICDSTRPRRIGDGRDGGSPRLSRVQLRSGSGRGLEGEDRML